MMKSSAAIIADPIEALKEQLRFQLCKELPSGSNLILYLNEPFNLYLLDDQADLYIETISTIPFERQLYRPLISLLQEHAAELIGIPSGAELDFIDLGPGLPDKTLPLVDYLDYHHSNFRYIPVDISERFLDITTKYFRFRKFSIHPQHILFEELPQVLKDDPLFSDSRRRIVNIGLTFNNFAPADILTILRNISGDNGIVLISTEIITPQHEEDLIIPYRSNDAAIFNFRFLQLLGFNRNEFEYYASYDNNRIEMGFIATRPLLFENYPINKGTKLLTSVSYRYFLPELRNLVERHFSDSRIFTVKGSSVCVIRLEEKNND